VSTKRRTPAVTEYITTETETSEESPEDMTPFYTGMLELVKNNQSSKSSVSCRTAFSQLEFGDYPKDYFNPLRGF
jgi:hypothetical protein